MYIHFYIYLLSIIICIRGERQPPKVGIVGAGIGGASAGFFLSREMPGAKITVFEMGEIGGRLATVEVDGRRYESGGSIIHGANRYMVEYLDICGLKRKETPPDEPFTLHKDGEVVFQEWGYPMVDKVRMLWRYGVTSLLKLDNFVTNLLSNFGTIYSKLNEGLGFSSVADLLDAMSPVSRKGERSGEMMDLTRVSLKDKLASLGLPSLLIDELVTVATRVNYGQMPGGLHAFVGAVGLAGVDGDLFAVEGGNVGVVQCALDMSQARVVRGEVKEVVESDGSFLLKYSTVSSGSKLVTEKFDLIIIASPLTLDKSSLSILPSSQVFPGSYHTTVATIVRGDLIPQGIGYKDNSSSTLTNFYLSPTSPLVSVAKLSPVDYNPLTDNNLPPVFKVFSTRPLTSTELSTMFSSIQTVRVTDWLAYPSYSVKDDLSSFQLNPGLFYTSRVEWAASAMEMSVISARNVANLAVQFWREEREGIVGEGSEKTEL